MDYCSIYITAATEEEALKIGGALVTERLAACANVLPIKSVYRWQGKVEESGESAMFIKTRSALVDRVIRRVKALHSYKIPCVVSFPIERGNEDYFKWIEESTNA